MCGHASLVSGRLLKPALLKGDRERGRRGRGERGRERQTDREKESERKGEGSRDRRAERERGIIGRYIEHYKTQRNLKMKGTKNSEGAWYRQVK